MYPNNPSALPAEVPFHRFHHPRRPHTYQLWFAYFATVVYAIAVPGLISIHNVIAGVGWGCACLLCFLWALLLRKENTWRKMEQLEVQQSPEEPYGSAPSLPPITHHTHHQPLLTNSSYSTGFPWYLTKASLVFITLISLVLLSAGIYYFIRAGVDHERLNGRSHWLAAIAFVGATKSAIQLGYRMKKVRNTYFSVMTYLKESTQPLP